MFFSLFLVFALGIIGGLIFEKIRIPKIIYYILLGILLGPSVFNIIDKSLIDISSYLRQIALIIILTRSGLNLDINNFKKMGRSALLLSFLPATFEIIGITIFGPLLLNINVFEAMLLGSVLAAVSPAIVVPRMIKLKEEGYGNNKAIPEMIMAGASMDDIFVIVLFYSFKGLVSTNEFNAVSLLSIPLSIILGLSLGLIVGFVISFIFKKININKILLTIIVLGISFGMVALETTLKNYVSISSLVSIIVMALIINIYNKDKGNEIKGTYNSLWQVFELLLFVLVGVATDVRYALSSDGAILVGLILIALVFRSLGTIITMIGTDLSFKERLFVVFSYLPKATVQASIGAIALNEGLMAGTIILTGAVISILLTAPLGALLIDFSYKKLLSNGENIKNEINIS